MSLVALLGLLTPACGGCEQTAGDPLRLLPAEPQVALVVPEVEALRARVVAYLAGVEGTSGVLALLAGRYGVDLASADGLRDAGIAPGSALVIFERDDAIVAATGVVDDDAFLELVGERLVLGAGGRVADAGSDGRARGPRLVAGPAGADGAPGWRAAFGVTDDHVGLVVVTVTPDADPGSIWAAAAQGAQPAMDRAALTRRVAALTLAPAAAEGAPAPVDAAAWFVVDGYQLDVPAGLGLATGVVERVAAGLTRWEGAVLVDDDRLRVRLASDFDGEGDIPVEWLGDSGGGGALAAAFPKTTTLLVRFGFAIDRIQRLPSFLRDRFLPSRIPGTAGLPLPELPDMIGWLGGDYAVALLGLDPGVTVKHLQAMSATGAGMFEQLHWGFAATVKSEEQARASFAGMAEQLRTSGWATAEVRGGGWTGHTFARGRATYSALIGHGLLVFVTGAGEVEHFLAVAEERALPLTAVAEGEPVAARALGVAPAPAGAQSLGGVLTFTRITRELAEKGVPPYFLKIINDFRIIAFAVTPTAKRVTLDLDVAL